MGKRDDRLIVEFDSDKIKSLCDWKRKCLGEYGNGGIKKRIQEFVEEDLKKFNSKK
jgi:hypothetical protein